METNGTQDKNSKETFIIRTEWWDSISDLNESGKAIFLEWLFFYHLKKPIENISDKNNREVRMIWKLIEPNLRRNIDYYDQRRETSKENGKRGGRPKSTNNLNNLKEPKKTLSDTDTDSDIDSETEYVSESENFKNLSHFDFLDFNFKKELLELVTEYKPKIIDWDFCIEKFNDTVNKRISITVLKGWFWNWVKNQSKNSNNDEPHKTSDKPKEKIGGF